MHSEVFDIGPSHAPYRIRLAVPAGKAPRDGWPVVTMLGHDAFDATCALVRYHADCRPPGYLDAGVLVGVGYAGESSGENRRRFDYTPALPADSDQNPEPDQTTAHTLHDGAEGGAQAFLQFLLQTLRPALNARLHVNPARQALAGHSLGGLFTLHTLFTQADAFQTYIASSPSVWWGNRYLERRAHEAVQTLTASPPAMQTPVAVQISAGEHEQTLSLLEQTRPDAQRLAQVRAQRAMVDGNRRVAQALAACPHLRVDFHVYPGQYHRSVWASALNLGLLTALRKAG